MKILFLINNAFGVGGTIQTTFNLAGALAERGHDVEVLSTLRGRDSPQMHADRRIRLMSLTETRPSHADHVKDARGRGDKPEVYPHSDYRAGDYDQWVEDRYRRYLRASDADVVIATRPGLIAYAARFAPRHMVRIGQEHLTRGRHKKKLLRAMPQHLRRLDAFVTVSSRDAEDYRQHLHLRRTKLLHIPNSIPAPRVAPSHGRAKLVLAAGRLVRSKRYDVLLEAFAKVVAERPDWNLRLYGNGQERDALRAQVLELGLHNHVRLMGAYSPIETEWAKGSIAAVSADVEPFGMTLVEAMRAGLPVVSTDAPHGPAEILDNGVDGVLTPVGDPDAMAAALLRVINDDEGRREMAARALENSARYDPGPIAEQYEKLFEELKARKWGWHLKRTPVGALGPATSLALPSADCEVTADGTIALQAPDISEMHWHRIGADERIPAGEILPAGSWQLKKGDIAVQSGRLDTRALLELHEATRTELPYRLGDGGLALRVVDAPARAEVDTIDVDDEGVHLTVRLVGSEIGDAMLVARGSEDREFPIKAGQVTIAPLPAGDWTLHIGTARLGRTIDDIIDKRIAYVLPSTPAMRPFFTAANELSISAQQ
ncbi:glycosyltransferase family 4 protein [Actinoplanes sp. GCM10030250]|uniref:glycosyltransferase family 4 protein n=1 Tax=Actinoplanes sp. GCM10030250 TaxID=3273376 RepID=UPI0036072E15